MNLAEVRDLFTYDEWANARVFRALGELTDEQFTRNIVSSFPSLQDTVGHIVAVEWIWLRRWQGESPTAAAPWASGSSRETLRQALHAVEAERAGFLAQLTAGQLQRVVVYRNLKGDEFRQELQVLLLHLVNHSTYHRGQVATLLRQVGATPPVTDFVVYRNETGPTA